MTPPPRLPVPVLRSLAAVRGRRRWLAFLEGGALGAGGVALLALLSLAVPHLPASWAPGLRAAAPWLLALALLGPWSAVLLPVWRRTSSLLRVARGVDDRVPATRHALLVAVDLSQGPAPAGAPGALVERHLEDAAELSRHVRPRELLPLSTLGRRSLLGPSLLLLVVLVAAIGPPSLVAGWAALFGPAPPPSAARAEEEVVDLELADLRLELTPPAYTGRPPLILEGTTGDFQALPGTRVRLGAELSRRGRAARVLWSGGATTEGRVDGDRVEVEFAVPGSGSWRLALDRGLGATSLTRAFRVEGVPDRPPELEVRAPSVQELPPEQPLPVSASTSDDFGLSRLELVVEKGGRVLARHPYPLPDGVRSFDGSLDFVAAELPGGEGGELELVVESADNDTVNGPKVTRSRPVKVYVPTPRDRHRRVLAMKQELLNRVVDLLGEVLVDDDGTHPRASRQRVLADHARHADAVAGVLKLGQDLGAEMADDRFEQQATFLGVGQLLENLARAWRGLDDAVAEGVRGVDRPFLDARAATSLHRRRAALVDELERIVLDLDAFVSLQQGAKALEASAGLEPSAARMADLLRQAQDGKPVSAELRQALDALQQQLADVAAALAERSGGPDDGFVTQLPDELKAGPMDEIQRAIDEGRFEDALARLKEAMEGISSLQDALKKEAADQAGAQVAQELKEQLDAHISEIKALEAQQQAVLDATRALQQRFGDGDGLDPKEAQDLDAAIQELRDGVAALEPPAAPGEPRDAAGSWERMALRQAVRLQEAWDQGAVAEAMDHAEMTAADLQELRRELGSPGGAPPAEREAAGRRAMEAEAQARAISEALQRSVQVARDAQQQASAASEGTQQQQQRVADGVSQLQQRMGEGGGSAFNPAGGREQLDGARGLMERAQGRLRQGRSGQAAGAEADALRQLQEARRSLEGAKQALQAGGTMGGRSGGRSGAGQSGGFARARSFGATGEQEGGEVEMSDPEDFVTPDALRALLQEGAADDAPERYRPVNRGYYEELAK